MQIFALNLKVQAHNHRLWLLIFCIFSKVKERDISDFGAHLNMFENKLLVSSKGFKFWNLILAKRQYSKNITT